MTCLVNSSMTKTCGHDGAIAVQIYSHISITVSTSVGLGTSQDVCKRWCVGGGGSPDNLQCFAEGVRGRLPLLAESHGTSQDVCKWWVRRLAAHRQVDAFVVLMFLLCPCVYRHVSPGLVQHMCGERLNIICCLFVMCCWTCFSNNEAVFGTSHKRNTQRPDL